MTFTELLNRFLYLRENVQVNHGPLWDDLQEVTEQLNALVPVKDDE
jgi:hypothetical protein